MESRNIDLSKIQPDTAKEVVRLSELFLEGTLKLSIAADARAMQIAGLSSAAATALAIFGFSYVFRTPKIEFALGISAFTAAIVFYIALFLALWSAQPRDFNISGNAYDKWEDKELIGDLVLPLISQADGYNQKIYENIDILSKNAKRIKLALKIMASAPIIAVLGGSVGYYFH